MELSQAYQLIEKQLEPTVKELGFSKMKTEDSVMAFKGNKGLFRVTHDGSSNILTFECAYDDKGEDTEFNTISKSLFDLNVVDEKDCKSAANEVSDEIRSLFATKKKVDLDKVKMPKAVSKSKAKNGTVSYDVASLANRFGTLYPQFKDDIKRNMVEYGEFLPEEFFTTIGNPFILDIIQNGTEQEQKKLFKLLGEIYEDGTNEVQDVIGVTILGEMKNDPKMMAVADKYMTEYMAGPVHEVNKLTAKTNSRLMKKLKNPPAYKPKKKKFNPMANALGQQ